MRKLLARRRGGLHSISVNTPTTPADGLTVLRVPGQMQFSKLMQWERLLRPHLGDIKGIEPQLLRIRLLWLHDLHGRGVRDLLTLFNGLPQVFLAVIRVDPGHLDSFLTRELLLSRVGEEVVLDVHELTLGVDPFKSMAAVAVVVPPALRRAMIGEEHQSSMVSLGCVGEQIERSVVIQQEVVWTTGLRADHVWALNGVSAEENGEIEAYNIVVAFTSIELQCETAWVAGCVGEFTTQGDRGEADKDWGLNADAAEEVGLGKV